METRYIILPEEYKIIRIINRIIINRTISVEFYKQKNKWVH